MLQKMLPMYQRVKYLTFLLVKNFSLNPLITSQKPNTQLSVGGVAEWLNAPVLKTDVGESLPWVRIPPPPPQTSNKHWEIGKALKWEPFFFSEYIWVGDNLRDNLFP